MATLDVLLGTLCSDAVTTSDAAATSVCSKDPGAGVSGVVRVTVTQKQSDNSAPGYSIREYQFHRGATQNFLSAALTDTTSLLGGASVAVQWDGNALEVEATGAVATTYRWAAAIELMVACQNDYDYVAA